MHSIDDLLGMVATEAHEGPGADCIDHASPEEVHKQMMAESRPTRIACSRKGCPGCTCPEGAHDPGTVCAHCFYGHDRAAIPLKYVDWIRRYLERHNNAVLGMCYDAVKEMRRTFPELEEVRGHVYCAWGKRGHVWAKDPEGTIIDPTASQFPFIERYEPWQPGMAVRVGACMHCGEDIWQKVNSLEGVIPERSTCSQACDDALAALYSKL